MKICILGWYGTETLGDRAILAGLLNIFSETFHTFSVQVGSLHPFFTKRTFFEDAAIYDEMASGVQINYFDVKNKALLKDEISRSDFVVMGGGPIMDVVELEIIEYAFRYAQKKSIKTAILGCGIGPLHKRDFIVSAASILDHSDLIILRDQRSLKKLLSCDFSRLGKVNEKACYAHDPAIIPVGKYLSEHDNKTSNHVAVNFREFPKLCFDSNIHLTDAFFSKLLVELSKMYGSVVLVPMHTFCIGGDDRAHLSKLKLMSGTKNIQVLHKPLNLYELFYQYSCAAACIGMRYHSVVFQTLLNGNNFIFDYTEEGTGKINSFLEMIDDHDFYKERYINLQAKNTALTESSLVNQVLHALMPVQNKFNPDIKIYQETLSTFKSEISKLW